LRTQPGLCQIPPSPPVYAARESPFASRLLQAGACLVAATCAPGAFGASGVAEITSIYSVAAAGYVREKLPDGSFKAETFAFGQGGHMVGPTAGDSVDKMSFNDLVKVLAVPLASHNYVQADEPANANLLIMVYWGTTTGTEGESRSAEYQNLQANQKAPAPPPMPMDASDSRGGQASIAMQTARMNAIQSQMSDENFDSAMQAVTEEEEQRRQVDLRNAMLLGYDSDLQASHELQNTVLGDHFKELVREIEEDRYFVVLMAYDFQKLWKEKKKKLLWVTRISIRQRGNEFGKVLPSMLQYASEYFGRDSHGLLRREIREGHVEVGEPTSIGVLPEK
jgi:hypothetical protein